jgi:hypothetical protein
MPVWRILCGALSAAVVLNVGVLGSDQGDINVLGVRICNVFLAQPVGRVGRAIEERLMAWGSGEVISISAFPSSEEVGDGGIDGIGCWVNWL